MDSRITLKTLKYTGLSFLVFVLLYALAVVILPNLETDKEIAEQEEVTIYIKSNGVHTDIVVPVKNDVHDWSKEIQFKHTLGKDSTAPFLGFGWGDKGFYLETPTWADLKASVAFNAVFGLSSTAMHTTYHKQIKETASCKQLMITKKQYARLVAYIQSGFRVDENKHVVLIKTDANYGDSDAFYEGVGKYSLFKTCNTWTNTALKSCGQKACWWTVFDDPILDKY
jgi:uncharacterized protein (TIGR02117 family)